MKRLFHLVIFLVLMTLEFQACKMDTGNRPLPDISIVVNPPNGATTDVIEITISPDESISSDRDFFYRWDWNNDGIWDTKYSTNTIENHRFYQAGNKIITIEMSDGSKQTKTYNTSIQITQGYSPPVASFSIAPVTGNPTTEFVFDASNTYDDEDSLNLLQFRWDPLGDGRWLFPYSSQTVAKYKYPHTGYYYPKLQVKDPSGRSTTISQELIVTLLDSLIYADFFYSPDSIEANDTVTLDASRSKYLPDSSQILKYSWFFPEQNTWTGLTEDNTLNHVFTQKGSTEIILKVVNPESGFYNSCKKTIMVYDENLPPIAKLRASCPYGNVTTQFYYDAWSSIDDRIIPSDLEIRWDFEGDGTWDTPYTKEKTIFHQFQAPGTYNTILQVRDDDSQMSTDFVKLIVSGYSNPTSFIIDPRDGNYYGTVKIGDQWWMAQNLNYMIPQKLESGLYQWICLNEQNHSCDQIGKLYYPNVVIVNRADSVFIEICPPGWHIPTLNDWEILINKIGGPENCKELRLGAKYDFNALDLGYARAYIPDGHSQVIYQFIDTYKKIWFFSSTEAEDLNNLRIDIWMWNTDRETGETWSGYGMPTYFMPVRCIKDN